PCILVGTQMLAKGHHFPKVTLVAVCDIDAGLFAADFRATEHTAQLLMQVAGRSGRGADQGTVILQTHQPAHPLLQTLLSEGYGAFATELTNERRLLGMPPYGYLALLRAESSDPRQAAQFLNQIEHWLQPQAQALNVEVWGPAPALMPKKARRYRFQLMLRAEQRPALQQLLKQAVKKVEQDAGHRLKWSVDVDPVTLD
ncbi:MAG TPA: primosomal protein N', partial [Gammaproteobacteria bacterium]|nr:primosomal protein N' [Gammaproteobacteria bacterium]